jgi:hypothetical protein
MNAKIEFRKLVMRKNDDYHEFLTKFLHLATEAAIPESDYKFELNGKLAFNLQKLVITNFISTSTFNEFSTHCAQAFHTLQNIASIESRIRKPPTGERNANTPKPPLKPLSDLDKSQLMQEGRCFNCKEVGHLSRNCPRKKPAANRKPTGQEITELESEQQGKEQP